MLLFARSSSTSPASRFHRMAARGRPIWTIRSTTSAAFSQLGVDAHQGGFDSYYPLINDFTLPGALYRIAGAAAAPSPVATYGIYTAMLFALMLLLGQEHFATGASTALLGAFIAAFFFPPLIVHQGAQTFRFMQLNPHWIQLIVLSALAIISIWALDGKWSLSRVLLIVKVPSAIVTVEVLRPRRHGDLHTRGRPLLGRGAAVLTQSRREFYSKARRRHPDRRRGGRQPDRPAISMDWRPTAATRHSAASSTATFHTSSTCRWCSAIPSARSSSCSGSAGPCMMLRDDNTRLRQPRRGAPDRDAAVLHRLGHVLRQHPSRRLSRIGADVF